MKTFAIASPFGGPYCYDYVVYRSLRSAMERLGFIYQNDSPNKIFLIGHPEYKYKSCDPLKEGDFSIALIGSGIPRITESFLKKFSLIFTSSPLSYTTLLDKTGIKPNGIWNLYSPFEDSNFIPEFKLTEDSIYIPETDIAFVGNARPRPAVEMLMKIIDKHPEWSFNYYGASIDRYMGNPEAKKYWTRKCLPYHQFPDLAKKVKVVLVDMHDDMCRYEMPSFKLIDFAMSKACILVAQNKYAQRYLGIPYFETPTQLEKLLKLHLNNESQRMIVSHISHDVVSKIHTVTKAAQFLGGLISTMGKR